MSRRRVGGAGHDQYEGGAQCRRAAPRPGRVPTRDGADRRPAGGSGLVQRRPGGDGQTLGLWPTRAGADAAAEVLAAPGDAVSAMLAGLAAQEAHQLSALLKRVLQSLPGTRDDARHLCRLCDQDLCGPPKCPVTRGIPRPARRSSRSTGPQGPDHRQQRNLRQTRTFTTGLAPGAYSDIIHGNLSNKPVHQPNGRRQPRRQRRRHRRRQGRGRLRSRRPGELARQGHRPAVHDHKWTAGQHTSYVSLSIGSAASSHRAQDLLKAATAVRRGCLSSRRWPSVQGLRARRCRSLPDGGARCLRRRGARFSMIASNAATNALQCSSVIGRLTVIIPRRAVQ
jgi:hypothetical protein